MSTFVSSEDPDEMQHKCCISSGSTLFARVKNDLQTKEQNFLKVIT